jgi:hypothetical protein
MERTGCTGPRVTPWPRAMRAVQITRFGGPEDLDVGDAPEPTPGPGQQLYDISTAGVNYADTHHRLTDWFRGANSPHRHSGARSACPEEAHQEMRAR